MKSYAKQLIILPSRSMCILASREKFAPTLRHDRAVNELAVFGRLKIDADAAALFAFRMSLVFCSGLAYLLLGRSHAAHTDQTGQGSERAEHPAAGKNVGRHEHTLEIITERCRTSNPTAEDISLRDQLFLRRRHMPQNNVVMRHLDPRMPGIVLERDMVDFFIRG